MVVHLVTYRQSLLVATAMTSESGLNAIQPGAAFGWLTVCICTQKNTKKQARNKAVKYSISAVNKSSKQQQRQQQHYCCDTHAAAQSECHAVSTTIPARGRSEGGEGGGGGGYTDVFKSGARHTD